MGANAQTSVPTFTAGQVLTAAQMNDSARTGVPVFADASARDAAFGGTGEKTLAEGQLCYLEDSNVVQYYDSTWKTLGPSATPGLVRLSGETSFSASSSVVLDGVFSSTYRNYKIIINYQTSAGDLKMRLRTGGSSTSTGTYNFVEMAANNTSVTAGKTVDAAQWDINYGNVNLNGGNEITIYAPFVTTPTIFYNAVIRHTTGYDSAGAGVGPILHNFVGNQEDSTSFDGFEIYPASGNITGTYTVYGLATS